MNVLRDLALTLLPLVLSIVSSGINIEEDQNSLPFKIPQKAKALGTYKVQEKVSHFSEDGSKETIIGKTTQYEGNKPTEELNSYKTELWYDERDSIVLIKSYEPNLGNHPVQIEHRDYAKNHLYVSSYILNNAGDTLSKRQFRFNKNRQWTEQVNFFYIDNREIERTTTITFNTLGNPIKTITRKNGEHYRKGEFIYEDGLLIKNINKSLTNDESDPIVIKFQYTDRELVKRSVSSLNGDLLHEYHFKNNTLYLETLEMGQMKTETKFDKEGRRLFKQVEDTEGTQISHYFYYDDTSYKLEYTSTN